MRLWIRAESLLQIGGDHGKRRKRDRQVSSCEIQLGWPRKIEPLGQISSRIVTCPPDCPPFLCAYRYPEPEKT